MSNCYNCNAEISETAKFCSECGATAKPFSATDFARKAKDYACEAADDMIDAGKEMGSSDLGKKMAAGAAVGALVVAPIPVIGWAAGATIGAGLVAFKHLLNKA